MRSTDTTPPPLLPEGRIPSGTSRKLRLENTVPLIFVNSIIILYELVLG